MALTLRRFGLLRAFTRSCSNSKSFDSFSHGLVIKANQNQLDKMDHGSANSVDIPPVIKQALSSDQLSQFVQLISQDERNFHLWTEICKSRPDILNSSSCETLLEIQNVLAVEIGLSKRKIERLMIFLPNEFLLAKNVNRLRESLTLWEGFCRPKNLEAFDILLEIPIVLVSDMQTFEDRYNDLRAYFASGRDVSRLVTRNPTILLEFWPKVQAKLEFMIHTMKVSPATLAKTKCVSFDLNMIQDRYDFLNRAGLYQHPDLKSKSLKSEAYPFVGDIVETKMDTFLKETCANLLTDEDFQLFVKLKNQEFDRDDESLSFLANGYEVEDLIETLERREKDAKGFK